MDRVVFFDTETTGLVEHKYPYTDERQPWPVSLAFIDWRAGVVSDEHKLMVRLPPGVTIHPNAEKVHGISFERTQDEGLDPKVVLEAFSDLVRSANYYAAYNLPFDDKVMRAMYHRLNPHTPPENVTRELYGNAIGMCVMEQSRVAMKVPSATGAGFRNLKLAQTYKRLCKKDLVNAHDAMADTRAALEIFEALLRVVDEPKKGA